MTRPRPRGRWLTTAAILTAAVALPAAGVTAFATTANASTPTTVGTAPTVPHAAVAVGATVSNSTLKLDVELAPRDPAALNAFVASVSDPHSANYKHYLAKNEFAAEFGPTRATVDAVTSQLRADGLNAGTPTPDGLTIPVTGTVAQVSSALGTGFSNYRLKTGRVAYANTSAPKLPAAVAKAVTGIVGLNNLVSTTSHVQSRHVATVSGAGIQAHVTTPNSKGASICAGLQAGLSGAVDGTDFWEPSALSASGVYNTGQLYGSYGNIGAGVTVGIVEFENFDPVDISNYQDCFSTHASVTTVKVDGGATAPVTHQPDVNGNEEGFETVLDVDAVVGMAPGASVIMYQGPDDATDQEALDTYQQMVNTDAVQVISTSWGGCELAIEDEDPGFLTGMSTIMSAAAAQGQSVLASSGDSGSTACDPFGTDAENAALSVSVPASLPTVTAVGGTSMIGASAPALATWNTPIDNPLGLPEGATGGGVSADSQLSGAGNYQSGVQGAGYSDVCTAAAGATCRQVPDVSALADLGEGYLVAFDHDAPDINIDFFTAGGTSLSAPLWAAITALADASTGCAANGPAGLLNPALYANPTAMVDVTTGNNVLDGTTNISGLYVTGAGYDLTTGLGSPKAPNVVEAVCNTPTTAAGSSYVPVSPVRVLDTRSHVGITTNTPIGAGRTIKLQITGRAGVPTTGVTAVVLNVTAVSPTTADFLTVFPDGTPRPASSNLNFIKGQTIPNLVTVPVGKDGAVDIFNHLGTVHALADLEGYYTSGTGSLYDAVTPVRVLDTRSHIGVTTNTPIGAGKTIKLPIEGRAGVPATGVTAVVLNVTATAPTGDSFLTVFPDGKALPVVSNLNFTPGQTIPNLVTVAVGADGAVDLFNHVGSVHAIADLAGYYTSTGTGLKFHPSTPHRLVDTRDGTGVSTGQRTPVGAGGIFSLPLTDAHGLGNLGPLATAGGLVLNVTVTAPTGTSFLTVYPANVARPGVSNLNYSNGQTIPNAVITPVNSGSAVDFFNHVGTAQVIADLFGYFATN
ncbi:MAG TPA: protease pro-enzyme activation domain-containing protein [Pseudonocardiaceae bacterium]|nr:protease pro-enzyme activation domain-containing protein [Pseudonocardiaceae bacterium]